MSGNSSKIEICGQTFFLHGSPGESELTVENFPRVQLAASVRFVEREDVRGATFRLMRQALNLTAADVAKLVDRSVTTISHWETERHGVDRNAWRLLADKVLERWREIPESVRPNLSLSEEGSTTGPRWEGDELYEDAEYVLTVLRNVLPPSRPAVQLSTPPGREALAAIIRARLASRAALASPHRGSTTTTVTANDPGTTSEWWMPSDMWESGVRSMYPAEQSLKRDCDRLAVCALNPEYRRTLQNPWECDGEALTLGGKDLWLLRGPAPESVIPRIELLGLFGKFLDGVEPPSLEQVSHLARRTDVKMFLAFERGSSRYRLASAILVGFLDEGRSLNAWDIFYREGNEYWQRPVSLETKTSTSTAVCFAAISATDLRNTGIASELVARSALPFLLTSGRCVQTSSPMTHWVSVLRRMVEARETEVFKTVTDAVKQAVRRSGIGSSLTELLRETWEYMRTNGIAAGPSYKHESDLLAACVKSLLTHEEVVRLREGDEQQRATIKTYSRTFAEVRRYAWHREKASSELVTIVTTLTILALMTQEGVYDAETGKSLDPIRNFHDRNGALLDTNVGVLPSSRPLDVAALGFGQVMTYPNDWVDRRVHYEETLERRRMNATVAGRVLLDPASIQTRVEDGLRRFLQGAKPQTMVAAKNKSKKR